MIIFPLKWLPYILTIGGIIVLADSGDATGLIPLAIGGIWLYFIYKGKNESKSSVQRPSGSTSAYQAPAQVQSNANLVNAAPANPSPYQQTMSQVSAGATHTAGSVICPNCTSQVGDGMLFCSKCGTKVR